MCFLISEILISSFLRIVPNLKKFSQAGPEKLCSREWDRWTDGQVEKIIPTATAIVGADA